ncbi:MAG: preprotein translocase subunit SecG [bacterium]|nr:MAG: preprotein translocase subunit SecG [bacterium]
MIVLLKILHIVVAVFLILVVLLQTGKGAEMGAAFGGSSQTLFGGGGPAGFMAKLTTAAAICFMVTSLSLAYVSSIRATGVGAPVTQSPVQAPSQAPAVPQGGESLPTAPSEGAAAQSG